MSAHRSRRGFTLVEALATIVLVAIVLPAALGAISLAARVSETARRKAEAAALGESKLHELTLTRTWQSGELSGDFGEDWPNYRWAAELRDWDDSTLKELDLHVFYSAGGRELSVDFATLVEADTL